MKKRILSILIALILLFQASGYVVMAEDEDLTDEERIEQEMENENDQNNEGSENLELGKYDDEKYYKSSENIALNAKVNAVSLDANNNISIDNRFPMEAMVDGDLKSNYATYKVVKTGFFTINFGEPKTFNKIILNENSLSMKKYSIYSSNNGLNWTKIRSIKGMNAKKGAVNYYFDADKENELEWDEIMAVEGTIDNLHAIHYFEPITAKYIKVDIEYLSNQQSNTGRGYIIPEVGVFNQKNVDTRRFTTALNDAKKYIAEVNSNLSVYDAKKVENLKSFINQMDGLTLDKLTQLQCEEYADKLVELRILVYRSRIYPLSEYKRVSDNVRSQLSVNIDYTAEEEIGKRDSSIKSGIEASKTMIKDGTSLLWNDIGTFENSRNTAQPVKIQNTFSRIRAMCLALTGDFSPAKGNKELLEAIRYALKIADQYWYSPEIDWFDSSMWSQMLGTPPLYSDVLLLLEGYLPQDELIYYANRLDKEMKDEYLNWKGINRMNIALANAKVGVVLKEYWRIDNLRIATEDDFLYVNEFVGEQKFYAGNGFYTDGTFLYHAESPYNGGYGQDGLLYNMNSIVALNDTPWELPDQNLVKYFIEIMRQGYVPIIFDGSMMTMFEGRLNTRGKMEKQKALEFMNTLSVVLPILNEPYKTEFKSVIKSWLTNSKDKAWESKAKIEIKDIMNDPTIPVYENLFINKVYHYADRIVHRRGNWSYGISMSSTRIKMYEGIGDENKQGWYSGSGMTYLYDADDIQYDDGFWFSADMCRLPGITVEQAPRKASRYQGECVTEHDYAGGASLNGEFGVAGMKVWQWESDLNAYKSWFMFDDEIVSLGSNINCMGDNNVETIVDNRVIPSDGTEIISINGTPMENKKQKTVNKNISTSHIAGRAGSNVGYYYPEPVTLNVINETRKHNISEFTGSPTAPKGEVTKDYATFYLNHGKYPENEKYSYVVLPEKTQEETQEYAKNPDIKIIQNSDVAHAVKEESLGITAVNLFEDKLEKIDKVTIDKQSSLIMREKDNIFELSVSDTTKCNAGFINITVDMQGNQVLSSSKNVEVIELSPKIKLKVNVKDTFGTEQNIKIALKNDVKLSKETGELLGNSIILNESINKAMVDGMYVNFINEPINIDDKLYYSIDDIKKIFAFHNLSYIEKTGEFILSDYNYLIKFKKDSNIIIVNDAEKTIANKTIMRNDKLYISLRDFSDIVQKNINFKDGLIVIADSSYALQDENYIQINEYFTNDMK